MHVLKIWHYRVTLRFFGDAYLPLELQGQETPPDEVSPYLRNLDAGDFQSMKSSANAADFAEAASQSSNQGEGLGSSGGLVSHKSGQSQHCVSEVHAVLSASLRKLRFGIL